MLDAVILWRKVFDTMKSKNINLNLILFPHLSSIHISIMNGESIYDFQDIFKQFQFHQTILSSDHVICQQRGNAPS